MLIGNLSMIVKESIENGTKVSNSWTNIDVDWKTPSNKIVCLTKWSDFKEHQHSVSL